MLCPVIIVNYSNATVSIIYNCRPHVYEYNIVAIIAMIMHVLLQYNRSVVSISPNPITYHNKQFFLEISNKLTGFSDKSWSCCIRVTVSNLSYPVEP